MRSIINFKVFVYLFTLNTFVCSQGLEVFPGSLQVHISDNELFSSEIKLTNNSDKSLEITSSFDIRWIKLEPSEFILLPGTSRKIKIIFFKQEEVNSINKSVIWFHSNYAKINASIALFQAEINNDNENALGANVEIKSYKSVYSEFVFHFRSETEKRFMIIELHENNIYISILKDIYFRESSPEFTEYGKKVFYRILEYFKVKKEAIISYNLLDFYQNNIVQADLERKNNIIGFFRKNGLDCSIKRIKNESFLEKNSFFEDENQIDDYLSLQVVLKW